MMNQICGLMSFIETSPTAFQAVENICRMLEDAGFSALVEGKDWELCPGHCYYVTRNLSSVIAFRIPKGHPGHFQIVSSHSDSPCFKLKPIAQLDTQGYALLNVEKYGGMIMQTWFDRPLSIAGRVIIRNGNELSAKLLNIQQNIALIPSVPIHFQRDVNDGIKLNPQTDMLPVVGLDGFTINDVIAKEAGVEPACIIGQDLYLYNRDKPQLWGAKEAFIAAPRLDDLECAFASVQGLIEAHTSDHVDMLCVFDNEEVGSGTRQGADSDFLTSVLERILEGLDVDSLSKHAMIARSFMISADNAHAIHPNHPEKYDQENRVRINAGVVIKFNANQKYTTDSFSQAVFETICRDAHIPVQYFANRSDYPGGSTLGNIANRHVSMATVDIGIAQLAMHSANETGGTKDLGYMIDAIRAFHETEIDVDCDGKIRLC